MDGRCHDCRMRERPLRLRSLGRFPEDRSNTLDRDRVADLDGDALLAAGLVDPCAGSTCDFPFRWVTWFDHS
jgi:hypothetical protein